MKIFLKIYRNVLISAIVAILIIPKNIEAQDPVFGIKGGLNLATLTIDGANDNNIIPGFHTGIFSKFSITEKVALKPEAHFSTKGVKTTYNQNFLGFEIADGETELNISYIDIPVYVAYYLSDDFNFHLGPYLGILMNSKIDTDADILNSIQIDTGDEIDRAQFNILDYGVSMGLGFSVDPVLMGFNYNLGINQVAKGGEPLEDLLGDAKNNVIQVYLGFKF